MTVVRILRERINATLIERRYSIEIRPVIVDLKGG